MTAGLSVVDTVAIRNPSQEDGLDKQLAMMKDL